MARPKIYKNAEEARQTETARKARYNAENYSQIRVWLPKEQTERLNI